MSHAVAPHQPLRRALPRVCIQLKAVLITREGEHHLHDPHQDTCHHQLKAAELAVLETIQQNQNSALSPFALSKSSAADPGRNHLNKFQ